MLKLWILGGIVTAILGLVLSLVHYVSEAEEAKALIVSLNEDLEKETSRATRAEANAAFNANSFEECRVLNMENTIKAIEQRKRADAALLRLARMEGQTNLNVEVVNREADQARGKDNECRTLDGTLPEWFVTGMREPAAP